MSDSATRLGDYFDAYKEAINQLLLSVSPESLQPIVVSVLPQYWQEWFLP